MKTFYMVYVAARNTPTVQFETIEEAEKEAERLCIKENTTAFVLKAVCRLDIKKVPTLYRTTL
jgi:hypothetical protein